MSRHDIDDLIRDELTSKLDPQRGRAKAAFDEQVIGPMTRRVNVSPDASHTVRNVILIALLMIVCVVIGMFIPKLFPTEQPPETPARQPEALVEAVTIPDAREHTSLLYTIDAGATQTPSGAPARRIRAERLDRYNWTDPQTGGTFMYIVPSVEERVLETHQQ
jgi:hypothetical protein